MIQRQRTVEHHQIMTCESLNFIQFERREQPMSPIPKPPGPLEDGSGPKRPDPDAAQKDNLLKRMRKVDPKQAERYRQRTGE